MIDKKKKTILNDERKASKLDGKKDNIDFYKIFQMQKRVHDDYVISKVVKRGEIIRKGERNYKIKCIVKFRRIVELNFFKRRTLKYFENLDDRKANVPLIMSLYKLKNTLDIMFPNLLYANVG